MEQYWGLHWYPPLPLLQWRPYRRAEAMLLGVSCRREDMASGQRGTLQEVLWLREMIVYFHFYVLSKMLALDVDKCQYQVC